MTARGSGDVHATLFEAHRPRLVNIAYGMLGSVMEAEDVVQDAYLRWAGVDLQEVDNPPAYLTTMTTRLAIDRLRSARARRETYVGPWLPEPYVSDYEEDPADVVAEAERLSMAMLVAFERLNPTERAVLLLREVFDLDYAEIADVVDKSPVNCRQIAARARQQIGDAKPPPRPSPGAEMRLVGEYLAAIDAGDVGRLASVFADDVVLWSDGGGNARAARHLLYGAERVARHLIGVAPQAPEGMEVRLVRVNGMPGILGLHDGMPIGVLSFDIIDDVVVAVRAILNPDKLEAVRLRA